MPFKEGGGNKSQPYDTNTGKYVKNGKENVLKGKTFYHGSPNKYIQSFDESYAGKNVGTDYVGIFFTDNKDFADDFSYERKENGLFFDIRGDKGKVYEAELDMKNPLDFNNLTEAQIKDIKDNYLANWGFGKDEMFRWFKQYLEAGNIQGAKTLINFKKIAEDGKYDGYIADLGGKYKGANEYVIFKGKQAKLKNPSKEKPPKKEEKEKFEEIDGLPF